MRGPPLNRTAGSGDKRDVSELAGQLPERPRVLVVDDERLLRTLARETLEKDGFAVIEASGGHEALSRFVETAPTRDLFADPKHPYTEALLRAVPRLDETVHEKLAAIEGMPPSLDRPFTACPFEPRCPLAEAKCRLDKPHMEEISPGHFVRCVRYYDNGEG